MCCNLVNCCSPLTPVYLLDPHMGGVQHPIPAMVSQLGQQPQQQPYQNREKKVLAITDPNTGRNVLEDLVSVSKSSAPLHSFAGPSSSRATPVSGSVTADIYLITVTRQHSCMSTYWHLAYQAKCLYCSNH